jgi:hypothetical protein
MLKPLVKGLSRMRRDELKRSEAARITDFRGPNVRDLKVSQTRLAPAQVLELLAEYVAGVPVRVLADRYGVARQTVTEHARRANIVVGAKVFSDAEVAEIVAAYRSGEGMGSLGRRHHVNSVRVREVLVEAGMPIRRQRGGRPLGEPRPRGESSGRVSA